SLENHYWQIC
ncbi:hypothetical protein MG7_04577, partial [Candida albicans P34048]